MVSATSERSSGRTLLCYGVVCIVCAAVAFPQGLKAAVVEEHTVSVEPACPSWTTGEPPQYRPIPDKTTVRYNPQSAKARLRSARAVSVIVADARGLSGFDSRTIPMTRLADGSWQADITPEKFNVMAYSIFFFQDEKGEVDNNGGQYWEVLRCFHSQVEPYAVETEARTYEGALLAPGIQRAPDLNRAIVILKADLEVHADATSHYPALWRLEVEKGGYSRAAYEQVGTEIGAFVDAHETDFRGIREISGFVAGSQRRLPAEVVQRLRSALIALPEKAEPIQINMVTKELIHIPRTNIRAMAHFVEGIRQEVKRQLAYLDQQAIDISDSDPHNKADAYLALAVKYAGVSGAPSFYGNAFLEEKKTGDVAATDAIFEKWIGAEPENAVPNLEMAKFYIERKIKPDRAVELLDTVQRIYAASDLPTSQHHYGRRPGELESLRGQAHLLLRDLPAARADFAAAAKAAPDDFNIADQLGQTCEQSGDTAGAMDAYLAAASAPYEANPTPREAFERLFVQQRLGNKQQAEERIARRAAERSHNGANEYMPVAMNRAAPDFAFVDLGGKRFDNQAAKGKPTVINLWGIWCAPCLAELPAIAQFQKDHPGVNLLAVAIGNIPDEVKSFLAARKLTGLHVASREDWPEGFGANGAPMRVVMDRFGQMQFVHVGQLADVGATLGKDVGALPEVH